MPELSEQAVRALLREVMAAADLENVTSKEVGDTGQSVPGTGRAGQGHLSPWVVPKVREELERRTGHSLAEHKDFIDNEMLLVLAQMDRPSRVFPHLFLVGSGAGGRAARVAVSPPLTAVTAQGSEWNAANLEELQQNR